MTAPKRLVDIPTEVWNVADLIPYERNAKKHPKDQVAKIAASIREFGFQGVILVDKNGVIIAGHGRRLALLELGEKTVPVKVLKHLTEEQVKAFRLAENRVGQSDYDTDMLRLELGEMELDMSAFFDAKELDFLSADLGTMNTDAFVEDMGAVLDEQKADLDARAAAATAPDERVALTKVFGFKDVPAGGVQAINRAIAAAEALYGVKGADALVAWAKAAA